MSSNPARSGEFGHRATPPPAAEEAQSAPVRPIVPKSARETLQPQAGTPPPKRSRQSRSQVIVFMNFLMSAVMFAVLFAGVVVYMGKRSFEAPGPTTTVSTFLVKPSTGVAEISSQLERRALITDARVFQVGVRAYGNAGQLKAGEYEIKAGASMHDIMEVLKSGRSVLYSLTIPEGLTVEQAFQRIAENEALSGDMPEVVPPEGSLAADTMRFTRGMSRTQFIDKMTADQTKMVEDIWNKRVAGLPLADINEFVTLASIVEKETGRGDERSRVAGVFVNRLRNGMRLQSDPTILYGLFGGKGRPADRPIYQSDIDKPTPYNTYVINGLPPTPIAIPGRAALEAVANPSQTDELYFVADGTGGHAFATTLEEHNENVARWRAIRRQQEQEATPTTE